MLTNKIGRKALIVLLFLLIYVIITLIYSRITFFKGDIKIEEKAFENLDNIIEDNLIFTSSKQVIDDVVYKNTVGKIVWDGLTLDELSNKLDRSLNSTLSGKGSLFASHSIELGLDPYLAVAIVLEETGCKWNCSYLVQACYNVGGIKGSPGCDGGSYKAFNSLDEGIISFLDNLYYNYYSTGLTTPEAINSKYAESTSWAYKVNSYIEKIKNN